MNAISDSDLTLQVIPAFVLLDVSLALYLYLYIPVYYAGLSFSRDRDATSPSGSDVASGCLDYVSY